MSNYFIHTIHTPEREARKPAARKKKIEKITYPPPADALCVRKKCKDQVRCHGRADQARRGCKTGERHCTVCKELKKSEGKCGIERPHSVHIEHGYAAQISVNIQ